jgi:hypothetical protein
LAGFLDVLTLTAYSFYSVFSSSVQFCQQTYSDICINLKELESGKQQHVNSWSSSVLYFFPFFSALGFLSIDGIGIHKGFFTAEFFLSGIFIFINFNLI